MPYHSREYIPVGFVQEPQAEGTQWRCSHTRGQGGHERVVELHW